MRAVALFALIVALVTGCGGDESSGTVVPYLVGLQEPLATQVVEEAGLQPTVTYGPGRDIREGFVYSQNPREGSIVEDGETVTLRVATGS